MWNATFLLNQNPYVENYDYEKDLLTSCICYYQWFQRWLLWLH